LRSEGLGFHVIHVIAVVSRGLGFGVLVWFGMEVGVWGLGGCRFGLVLLGYPGVGVRAGCVTAQTTHASAARRGRGRRT